MKKKIRRQKVNVDFMKGLVNFMSWFRFQLDMVYEISCVSRNWMMVTQGNSNFYRTNGQARLQTIDLSLQQFSLVLLSKGDICNRAAM